MLATVRSASRVVAPGSGILARALGGAASPSLQSGAVCQGGDAAAGSDPFVRGFAWLGFGGGGGGGGWGGGWGGGGWIRGLSSSSGALSASSLDDKLAANRAAREHEHLTPGEKKGGVRGKAARGESVRDRADGGAARGRRGGDGAGKRVGDGSGGGGRGGGGSGAGRTPAAAARPPAVRLGSPLKTRIDRETDSVGLLQLVTDELPNFNASNVSHAFCKLGKLSGSNHVPDDSFRGLMVRVREMCVDGQLEVQDMSNIMSSVAKRRAAGKLATDAAGVEDMLAALEQRVIHVAPSSNSHGASNLILAFSALGRQPGAVAWAALEAAVVRVAPQMHMRDVSSALFGFAKLGQVPGAAALAALEAGAHNRPLVCTATLSRFCHQTPPRLSVQPSNGALVEPKSGRMSAPGSRLRWCGWRGT